MKYEITASFVVDNPAKASKLRRQIEAFLTEENNLWALEVKMGLSEDETSDEANVPYAGE